MMHRIQGRADNCPVLRLLHVFVVCGAVATAQERPRAELILDASMTDIQEIRSYAPEYSILIFKAGVYRNLSLPTKKGDVFLGLPGATLNGSELVTFKQVGPRLW